MSNDAWIVGALGALAGFAFAAIPGVAFYDGLAVGLYMLGGAFSGGVAVALAYEAADRW